MSLAQQLAKQFLSSKSMENLETEFRAILPDIIPTGHLYRLQSVIDGELIKEHRRAEMRKFNNGQPA